MKTTSKKNEDSLNKKSKMKITSKNEDNLKKNEDNLKNKWRKT